MCSIVVVSVGGYAGNPREPFTARGFATPPPGNPACTALPAKSVTFEVTAGGCSCCFYIGDSTGSTFDVDRERRRYRRKGWPAEKIEKRIALLLAAREDSPSRSKRDEYGFVDSIENLARARAKITLLAHSFRGAFNEPFEIAGTTELPLQHFLDSGGEFPEDRLVSLIP